VLSRCRPGVALRPLSHAEYERPASVPRWAVLDSTRAETLGIALRPWTEALEDYLAQLCPPQAR
jgi:dTDP-4-dehydrorhamnose reductase